ncbi:MAG TPA: hypothetical protein VJ845_00535 [Haploplasma sp.]|nr:hypothetical protein [Haploplasma sp.]
MDVSENEVIENVSENEVSIVSEDLVIENGLESNEIITVSDNNIVTLSGNIIATISPCGDILVESISDNVVSSNVIQEVTENYYEFTTEENEPIIAELQGINASLTILIGVTIYFGLRASIKKFVRGGSNNGKFN